MDWFTDGVKMGIYMPFTNNGGTIYFAKDDLLKKFFPDIDKKN